MKRMTKLLSILLVLTLLANLIPAAVAADPSGSCGENLTWVLHDGTLTISGTGPMDNYVIDTDVPWFSVRNDIQSIVIKPGVTYIGNFAFAYCTYVSQVSIPGTVARIGEWSFLSCEGLEELTLPEGLVSVADCAFYSCCYATRITLPSTLKDIGAMSFADCAELISITFPEGIERIGWQAFIDCHQLCEVVFTGRAPILEEACFFHVYANVYYPPNEPTWTKDNMTEYMGSLTWFPREVAPVIDPEPTEPEPTEPEPVPAFEILTQPENFRGEIGQTAQFTVAAQGTGISYQWYYSSNQGHDWSRSGMTGCNTPTLKVTMTAARVGQMYRCTMTDAEGKQLQTNAVSLNLAAPAVTAPVIRTQPKNHIGDIGSNAVFTLEAEGQKLTYQWYYSVDHGKSWSRSGMTGSTTPTLKVTMTAARVGQMYRCIVTNAAGEAVVSQAVSLLLTPPEDQPLAILAEPVNHTGVVGSVATFRVEAMGEGITYQWYYSPAGGKSWSKSGMTGSNTAALTVTMTAARVGQMYRCVLTDAQGNTVTTQAVSLNRAG